MTDTTTDRESVCIPTGFDSSSYSCVRSLSERGIHTIVASEYEAVPAGGSRFCDEQLTIPSPYDDLLAYKDALVGIAARPDVRTIVPIRPHDPYLFAHYADEFDPYVSILTPGPRLLSTVHDRIKLADAAETAGVPVPETRLLTDVDDWSSERIVKSRYNLLTDAYLESFGPNDSETVKAVTHLRPGEPPDVDRLIEEMNHVPIAQEYVRSADEYVFGALYDHGEPLLTFQHRQIRGDSYTGGGGVYRETVSIPELEAVGRTLLDSLEYHGLACIEYMEDADTGEFVLTEINPRMWQSLPCAVLAGADFPASYWLATQGRSHEIDPGYAVGFGSHLLYGELGYLRSIVVDESPLVDRPSLLAEVSAVVRSCYRMPHFDVLRVDDPRPFLRGLTHVVKRNRTR
ncbi:MAG: carboxylate--amine ligase [Halobacteriota archaeon]